jgi:hypothetical protein
MLAGRDSAPSTGAAAGRRKEQSVETKLELVPVPVVDIGGAKAFYVDRLGFVEDVDVRPTESVRAVQLTLPVGMLDRPRIRSTP